MQGSWFHSAPRHRALASNVVAKRGQSALPDIPRPPLMGAYATIEPKRGLPPPAAIFIQRLNPWQKVTLARSVSRSRGAPKRDKAYACSTHACRRVHRWPVNLASSPFAGPAPPAKETP
jgi:hypothetical protein